MIFNIFNKLLYVFPLEKYKIIIKKRLRNKVNLFVDVLKDSHIIRVLLCHEENEATSTEEQMHYVCAVSFHHKISYIMRERGRRAPCKIII